MNNRNSEKNPWALWKRKKNSENGWWTLSQLVPVPRICWANCCNVLPKLFSFSVKSIFKLARCDFFILSFGVLFYFVCCTKETWAAFTSHPVVTIRAWQKENWVCFLDKKHLLCAKYGQSLFPIGNFFVQDFVQDPLFARFNVHFGSFVCPLNIFGNKKPAKLAGSMTAKLCIR